MNSTTLVIGASSDVGLHLIKNMDEGNRILAHYNKSDSALKLLAETCSADISLLQADLSCEAEILAMLDRIEVDYGTPDKIVFLAAGTIENVRFKDFDWSSFEYDINISLKATILTLRRFLPKMAKMRSGKVVLMLSSYVLGVPPKALSHYTTIKYSLLGLMKSLASEYGSHNIQINAVSPSMIDTKFLNTINEKVVELNAFNHPMKRNAKVDDIIPVIKMLLSPEADYINGVNIPIAGGSVF